MRLPKNWKGLTMSADKGPVAGSKGGAAGAADRPVPVAQPALPEPPAMQEFSKSIPNGDLFKRGE